MPQAALALLQGKQAGQGIGQGAASEPEAPASLLGWLQELGGCQGLGHPSRVGPRQVADQVQALGCNTGTGCQAGLQTRGKGEHHATLMSRCRRWPAAQWQAVKQGCRQMASSKQEWLAPCAGQEEALGCSAGHVVCRAGRQVLMCRWCRQGPDCTKGCGGTGLQFAQ